MNQYSILKDRKLWFDGVSEVTPSSLEQFLFKQLDISNISVTEVTEDIKNFNNYSDVKISTKSSCNRISTEYNLPEKYKYLDIEEYLISLSCKIEKDHLYEKRIKRFQEEMVLFLQLDLTNILKVIIHIIDTFKEKNTIWGVGRGSSCSSYIFYLMDLHSVDCVLYDIDIKDFIK